MRRKERALLLEHLGFSFVMTFLIFGGMVMTSPLFLVHAPVAGWVVEIGWLVLWGAISKPIGVPIGHGVITSGGMTGELR